MNTVKIKRPLPKRRPGRRTYHHGDLRHGLLAAAEAIILERGIEGFTLREAARRAGVSPAAPAHHFGDARGLLTELAMLGFRDFGDALAQADAAGGDDPAERLKLQAVAYVRFALAHPARFELMFRHDKHDKSNEAFMEAAQRAYGVLDDAIRAATGTPASQELSATSHGLLLTVWSIVHGFSHLALGGEMRNSVGDELDAEEIVRSVLPRVLAYLPSSVVPEDQRRQR